jgi:hypothetical protein
MTSHARRPPTTGSIRRRTGIYRFGDNVRAGRVIGDPGRLAARQTGRAWLNGREVGGQDPRYKYLDESYE